MSTTLLDARRQVWPTDWAIVFGRDAPLWIEIGFGNGQFLVDLAEQRRDVDLLGLEISLPSLRRAQRRVEQARLTNVRLLSCGGLYALWALCAPASVEALFINFPDPWHKADHYHRRLIDDRFLCLAASRLRPEARLEIATDHVEYAQAIAACLSRSEHFVNRQSAPWSTTAPQRTKTKYEQIALEAGRTCFYFAWKRNRRIVQDAFPAPEEIAMPHVIMASALSITEIAARFAPMDWAGKGVQGRFLDLLQSRRGGAILIDTYVSEEPFSQRVALTLRTRHGDASELILGLHELGFPRPTTGIHLAIAALTRWLLSLHPDMQVKQENLQASDVTIPGVS
jgi:tRNA (guanine-N7-)-methyltransferase